MIVLDSDLDQYGEYGGWIGDLWASATKGISEGVKEVKWGEKISEGVVSGVSKGISKGLEKATPKAHAAPNPYKLYQKYQLKPVVKTPLTMQAIGQEYQQRQSPAGDPTFNQMLMATVMSADKAAEAMSAVPLASAYKKDLAARTRQAELERIANIRRQSGLEGQAIFKSLQTQGVLPTRPGVFFSKGMLAFLLIFGIGGYLSYKAILRQRERDRLRAEEAVAAETVVVEAPATA